jgi:four helix bundle protein
MMPYEKFEAWQVAHELALEIYRVTDKWPKEERFGLTIQLRRAALSAPTNIAEGAAKRGNREFRRFLDIALGSLSEVSPRGSLTWRLYLSISRAAQENRNALTWTHFRRSVLPPNLLIPAAKSSCARPARESADDPRSDRHPSRCW